MANEQNLKIIRDSKRAKEVGAMGGRAKKGSKHINTHIQELMDDDEFDIKMFDSRDGYKSYKGRPLKAILEVISIKALNGDLKAADMLLKYGWPTKQEVEHSGEVATGQPDAAKAAEFEEFLKGKTKQ